MAWIETTIGKFVDQLILAGPIGLLSVLLLIFCGLLMLALKVVWTEWGKERTAHSATKDRMEVNLVSSLNVVNETRTAFDKEREFVESLIDRQGRQGRP